MTCVGLYNDVELRESYGLNINIKSFKIQTKMVEYNT